MPSSVAGARRPLREGSQCITYCIRTWSRPSSRSQRTLALADPMLRPPPAAIYGDRRPHQIGSCSLPIAYGAIRFKTAPSQSIDGTYDGRRSVRWSSRRSKASASARSRMAWSGRGRCSRHSRSGGSRREPAPRRAVLRRSTAVVTALLRRSNALRESRRAGSITDYVGQVGLGSNPLSFRVRSISTGDT